MLLATLLELLLALLFALLLVLLALLDVWPVELAVAEMVVNSDQLPAASPTLTL